MKQVENTTLLKQELREALQAGELTLGQATKRMRKIVGMTQEEFAKTVLKITPRILVAIENDRGNPTLATLNKIAKPFGYDVGFVRRDRSKAL